MLPLFAESVPNISIVKYLFQSCNNRGVDKSSSKPYHNKRMGNSEQRPDSAEQHSVPPTNLARIALRQQLIADNFVERIVPHLTNAGEDGALLLGYQAPYIQETQDFFAGTRNEIGRRILWPSPPNFGKTALSAVVARSAGIGDSPADPERLRGLVFVPRRISRTHIKTLYGQLTPDIKIDELTPAEGCLALNRLDMLVMTYKAGASLGKQALDYLGSHTDLVILDEVHRGIGARTANALNYLFDNFNPTILAMSATHEYNEDHSAVGTFNINRSITPMTPRESIEKDLSNGVQLYAIFTGEKVHFISRRDEITPADVKGLNNPERNRLIIDLVKEMTLDRRQGIIQCLQGPGSGKSSNAHSVLIAEMASRQRITDPATGEDRFLRVEAVGNHRKDNEEVVARFKRGSLDALTFSKYLIEMFDHPIRYIIYGAPTTSRVDVDQLSGRGVRRSKDMRPTMLLYLTDAYTSRVTKRLKTPFQTYEVETAYQGMLLIPSAAQEDSDVPKVRRVPSTEGREQIPAGLDRPYSPLGQLTLSDSILNALAHIPPGTILEQEIIIAERPEVPDGYVPLQDLPVVAEGKISMEGAVYILKQKLQQDSDTKLLMRLPGQSGRTMLFVSPDAQEYLAKRYEEVGNKVTRAELNNFLSMNGWPALHLEVYLDECKEAGAKLETVKKAIVIDPEHAKKILYNLAATPLIDPRKELSLTLLASVLDTHSSVINKLARQSPEHKQALSVRRKSLPPQQYRSVQVMSLEAIPSFIEHVSERSDRLATQVAIMGIKGVIAAAQRPYLDYYEKYNLHPALTKHAIDSFITSMRQARVESVPSNPTRQAPQPEDNPAKTTAASTEVVSFLRPPSHPRILDGRPSDEWIDLGDLLDLANCTPLAARYVLQMVHGEHLLRHSHAKRIEVNKDIVAVVRNICSSITRRAITTEWVSVLEAEKTLRAIGKDPKAILPEVAQKLFRAIDGGTGRVDLYCNREELNFQAYRPRSTK